jgi:cell division protein FtsB
LQKTNARQKKSLAEKNAELEVLRADKRTLKQANDKLQGDLETNGDLIERLVRKTQFYST